MRNHMKSMLMGACLALMTTFASAQPLNPLWFGTWSGGPEPIVINSEGVQDCAWVGSRPDNDYEGCVSFYGDSIDRSDIAEVIESEKLLLARGLSEGFIMKEFEAQIKATMARNEQLIAQIEEGRYRTVSIEEALGRDSGDCWNYMILDRDTLYRLSQCEGPAEPSLEIVRYTK